MDLLFGSLRVVFQMMFDGRGSGSLSDAASDSLVWKCDGCWFRV